MLKKLIVIFGAVMVVLTLSGLVLRAWEQQRLADAMVIRSANGIDDRRFVQIGGIPQWISIRGQDRDNPVVLILHGGPGAAIAAPRRFLPWEREFTVIQWDQRGAGRSYRSRQATPNIDLMVKDAIEVSEYVRSRLPVPKMILIGHSWGSVLGVRVVKARPDLFSAYVGTGQIVNMQKNEASAYARVVAKARARGDRGALDALQKSGPPPYHNIRQMGLERRWASQYEPNLNFVSRAGQRGLLVDLLTAPDYSLKDVVNYFRAVLGGDDFYGQTMDGPMMRVDLPALGTGFSIPFFIVEGAEDDVTPATVAHAYFDQIASPRKAFRLIADAGHMAVLTKPDDFLKLLLTNVRCLARWPETPRAGSQTTPCD